MKALVLGCGEMGAVAIEDLYRHGNFDKILVGTRSLAKAKKVLAGLRGKKAKVAARRVEAEDAAKLIDLMKSFDVVVNCVGPNYKYEVRIAKAAIKAKVNLIDINDDYKTTFEMFDLDARAKKAGIIIILGLGASPGVNNIIARAGAVELDEVEEIHTAWVMSAADPGGLALSYHLLFSLSGKALTWQDGNLVEVQSFVDGKERMEFPEPVGTIDVYHIGHPEPLTLSRCFPGAKYIDDKASFNPPLINDIIVSLGKMVRDAAGPITVGKTLIDPMDFAAAYLLNKCRSIKGIPKPGALRVEVKGKKAGKTKRIIYSSCGRIVHGTGMPASIGAQMLVQGKVRGTGVQPPEQCIDPNEFLQAILSRGIGELQVQRIEA